MKCNVPVAEAINMRACSRSVSNSYVRKPVNVDQFSETIRQLGRYWLAVNEPPPDAPDQ